MIVGMDDVLIQGNYYKPVCVLGNNDWNLHDLMCPDLAAPQGSEWNNNYILVPRFIFLAPYTSITGKQLYMMSDAQCSFESMSIFQSRALISQKKHSG